MSYKIEITAGTMNELAGKLLAMAATMQAVPSDPVMPEVKEAAKPARKAKAAPVKEETGNAEPVSPAEETSASSNDEQDTASAETAKSLSEPEAKPLDFDKDVAPVVLQAVKQRGKEWVQEILSQFGVERASLVSDDRMGELVTILKDGLE